MIHLHGDTEVWRSWKGPLLKGDHSQWTLSLVLPREMVTCTVSFVSCLYILFLCMKYRNNQYKTQFINIIQTSTEVYCCCCCQYWILPALAGHNCYLDLSQLLDTITWIRLNVQNSVHWFYNILNVNEHNITSIIISMQTCNYQLKSQCPFCRLIITLAYCQHNPFCESLHLLHVCTWRLSYPCEISTSYIQRTILFHILQCLVLTSDIHDSGIRYRVILFRGNIYAVRCLWQMWVIYLFAFFFQLSFFSWASGFTYLTLFCSWLLGLSLDSYRS